MTLRIANLIARIVVAGAFIYAGIIKVQGQLQFAATIESYKLVPTVFIPWIVSVLPWFEIVLGVFLLTGWKSRWFGAVAALLLFAFIAAMGITYARGIEADCGCFGPGDRISPRTLLRDAMFLIPSLFLAFQPRPRLRDA
jgi:uncharacterized membrane protein YphA (DoxX/SURF4 family)